MNEQILAMWLEQDRLTLTDDIKEKIIYFIKFMDKHSMWLTKFENEYFHFSNDAQRINFSKEEILEHVRNRENGIPFPWKNFHSF